LASVTLLRWAGAAQARLLAILGEQRNYPPSPLPVASGSDVFGGDQNRPISASIHRSGAILVGGRQNADPLAQEG